MGKQAFLDSGELIRGGLNKELKKRPNKNVGIRCNSLCLRNLDSSEKGHTKLEAFEISMDEYGKDQVDKQEIKRRGITDGGSTTIVNKHH